MTHLSSSILTDAYLNKGVSKAMPASFFLQPDAMFHQRTELDGCDAEKENPDVANIKQENSKTPLVGKLVCFFCDKEFFSADVLHQHQDKCSLVSDIQTVLACAQSSRGEKRGFLSHFNLIPKGKADHLLLTKRKDVVFDVIVIGDESDDESKDDVEDRSVRRFLAPTSSDSRFHKRQMCSEAGQSRSIVRNGLFAKCSSKLFKFDISSPLGMRLRYHGKENGDSRPQYGRIINSCYEDYCGMSAIKTAEALSWNRHYPVTYRKNRQLSRYSHKYKFTQRQLRDFCQAHRFGLSLKSCRLKKQMKPCAIQLKKLSLQGENADGTYNVKQYFQLLPSKPCATENLSSVVDTCAVPLGETLKTKDCVLGHMCMPQMSSLKAHEYQKRNFSATSNEFPDAVSPYLHGLENASAESFTPRVDKDDSQIGSKGVSDECADVYTHTSQCSDAEANEHFDWQTSFFKNAEFVPLSALYSQTLDMENHENRTPQSQMFQISSVFSLAGHHFSSSQAINTGHENMTRNIGHPFCNSISQKISSPLYRAEGIVTILDSDSSLKSLKPNDPLSATTVLRVEASAKNDDVIDLTKNASSLEIARSSASFSQGHTMGFGGSTTSGLLDMAEMLGMVTSKDAIQVSESSAVNLSELSKVTCHDQGLGKAIVIEIPDEEGVESKQRESYSLPIKNSETFATLSSVCPLPTAQWSSQSARQPVSQNLIQTSATNHCASLTAGQKRNISHCNGKSIAQSSDTIDLSFDSDCEALDSDPLTVGQKRPSQNNTVSPPQKRAKTGVMLENSQLPALTFRCHICGSLFSFNNNSVALIQSHYLTHGIRNIELVKQCLPNGQITWSLVEHSNRTPSLDPKQSSPPDVTVIQPEVLNCNRAFRDGHSRPSVTLHYSPNVSFSSNATRPHHSDALANENISSDRLNGPSVSHSGTTLLRDENRFVQDNIGKDNSIPNVWHRPVNESQTAALHAPVLSAIPSSKDALLCNRIRGRAELPAKHPAVRVSSVSEIQAHRMQQIPFSSHPVFPPPTGVVEQRANNFDQSKTILITPSEISSSRPKTSNVTHSEFEGFTANRRNSTHLKHSPLACINANNSVQSIICLD